MASGSPLLQSSSFLFGNWHHRQKDQILGQESCPDSNHHQGCQGCSRSSVVWPEILDIKGNQKIYINYLNREGDSKQHKAQNEKVHPATLMGEGGAR